TASLASLLFTRRSRPELKQRDAQDLGGRPGTLDVYARIGNVHWPDVRDGIDEAGHLEARPDDAASRRVVPQVMPNPEALAGGAITKEGMQEHRLDAPATPLRQGHEIPEIAVAARQDEV